jgi:hypothetical protein
LIDALDSPEFAVREKAQAELQSLGQEVASALREALKARPSPEKSRRLTRALDKVNGQRLSGDTARGLRVIDLLEQQSSPEARGLLELLARGAPGAWVTEEAKATLRRLGK